MEYVWRAASPLGNIILASDGDALTGLWFEGQAHFAETLDPEHAERAFPIFDSTLEWLAAYFSGSDPGRIPSLAPKGTPFRQAVWKTLLTIPYGHVVTYGTVAAFLSAQGIRTSARAVGGAVGHNPISIFIPCHRVVGANGSLTGYAGGLERKRVLLLLENQNDRHL